MHFTTVPVSTTELPLALFTWDEMTILAIVSDISSNENL